MFDARGQMVGNYEGYDNFGKTEWDLLRDYSVDRIQPFLDVPRDWEYVTLRREDLTNLEYLPKEGMEIEIDSAVLAQNFELSSPSKVNLAALFEDPSKFNAEFLSYDDDWSIFW